MNDQPDGATPEIDEMLHHPDEMTRCLGDLTRDGGDRFGYVGDEMRQKDQSCHTTAESRN